MPDANAIAKHYINLWNETDPVKRRASLADIWMDDGTYVDPLMKGSGHEEIDALIVGVQTRFPTFRFVLDGSADGYGCYVRFSWSLGAPQSGSVIKGTDFCRLDGERLRDVTGFLDQAPAGLGASPA